MLNKLKKVNPITSETSLVFSIFARQHLPLLSFHISKKSTTRYIMYKQLCSHNLHDLWFYFHSSAKYPSHWRVVIPFSARSSASSVNHNDPSPHILTSNTWKNLIPVEYSHIFVSVLLWLKYQIRCHSDEHIIISESS